MNPNITWDFLTKNTKIKINWHYLSINPSITWDIVSNNLSLPWDWEMLTVNPSITRDVILDNPNLSWNMSALHSINKIDEFLAHYWDLPKDKLHLMVKDKLSIDQVVYLIENNISSLQDEDWYDISRNPNISLEFISQHKNLPWNWDYISLNPNITWKIIYDNPDKPWNVTHLLHNEFNRHTYYHEDKYRQKMNSRFHGIIHDELIRVACHPRRVLN